MSSKLVFLAGVFSACFCFIGNMVGQSEGQNAIYSGSAIAGSRAYIDAYAVYSDGNKGNFDFCKTINGILTLSFSVNA
jgi:hypothetical protein